jgi:hypothetical protein
VIEIIDLFILLVISCLWISLLIFMVLYKKTSNYNYITTTIIFILSIIIVTNAFLDNDINKNTDLLFLGIYEFCYGFSLTLTFIRNPIFMKKYYKVFDDFINVFKNNRGL